MQRFCNGLIDTLSNSLKSCFRIFNTLPPKETGQNPVKYFEVLAGAISWGFKSPSPHHILNGLAVSRLTLFT